MLGAAPAARRWRGVSTIYPRQINKPVLGPGMHSPVRELVINEMLILSMANIPERTG